MRRRWKQVHEDYLKCLRKVDGTAVSLSLNRVDRKEGNRGKQVNCEEGKQEEVADYRARKQEGSAF